jgi:hypothetical protein
MRRADIDALIIRTMGEDLGWAGITRLILALRYLLRRLGPTAQQALLEHVESHYPRQAIKR